MCKKNIQSQTHTCVRECVRSCVLSHTHKCNFSFQWTSFSLCNVARAQHVKTHKTQFIGLIITLLVMVESERMEGAKVDRE